jgi:polar amino acid transport system substrate-binding protein
VNELNKEKTMSKFATLMRTLGLFFIASFLQAGGSSASDSPVRIGTEGTWKPFSYQMPDGSLVGLEVDLAREVCKKAGLTCELVIIPFDSLIPALQENKIDAIASGLRMTEKRKKVVAFAEPYYRLFQTFSSCKYADLKDISPAALDGKSVGVQVSTASLDFLKARYANLDIRTYKNMDDIFADLGSGRLDLALTNQPSFHGFSTSSKTSECKMIGEVINDPDFFSEPTGLALRKGDSALRDRFNVGITKVLQDGSFEEINARYLPFSVKDTVTKN